LRKSDSVFAAQGALTTTKPRSHSSTSARRDGEGNAIHNLILLGLPRKECSRVFSALTLVDLSLHEVLQEAGQAIEFSYFPNTAMASVLTLMTDGKGIEVGLVGKEGFVGLPLMAGFRSSATRVNTQGAGTAYRIDAAGLAKALRNCPKLMSGLLRYWQEATMQVTQIAACNRLHEVGERLARWLLMCRDRMGSDTLPLTQEFLSQMLGIRRASVSVAAAILQKRRVITYNRGSVTILNRRGLEKACCECYGVINQQIKSWKDESRGARAN
jgi:CRP-like cAMP-binding protein